MQKLLLQSIVLGLITCPWALSFANASPQAQSQQFNPPAYRDTAADLQSLLTSSIDAARSNQNVLLDQIVESMRIPNYQEWFEDSEYHSESWAEAYGKQVTSPYFGVSLKCKLHRLAEESGFVTARRINDGGNRPGGFEDGWLRNQKRPFNAYLAEWRSKGTAGNSRPHRIGYFIYAEGGFRWYSLIRQPAFLLPGGWMPLKAPQPVYPYPLDGHHPCGFVHLSFLISDNGSLKRVKVISKSDSTTDRALIQSAVTALRHWKLFLNPRATSASREIDDLRVRVAPTEAY